MMRRAARFVAKEPKSVGAGHVMAIESFKVQAKGDLSGALDLATRAHDIAIEADDPELESVALSRQGRLHIRLGDVDEGQMLLDEAMTIVQDDRVPPILSAVVYCTVSDACTDLADYERANEWSASASSYCESGAVGGFPGICRIHRAELLRMRGRWREAAEEAECACAVLNSFGMNLGVAMGEAEVGMVKFRLGDLDAADEAFTAAHRRTGNPNSIAVDGGRSYSQLYHPRPFTSPRSPQVRIAGDCTARGVREGDSSFPSTLSTLEDGRDRAAAVTGSTSESEFFERSAARRGAQPPDNQRKGAES